MIFALLGILLVNRTRAACRFPYNFQVSVTTESGTVYDDIDLDKTDTTVTFEVGEKIIVKCVDTVSYQFVNDIRKIDGVDTFSMDQGNGITVVCGVGDKMNPDISKDVLGNDRYLFCAEGCTPVREDKYKVTYNDAIVTNEGSSAPIRTLNDAYIYLACQPGYTIATGTEGKSETYCRYSASGGTSWYPTKSSFINCVRGCPDISSSVSNGVTTDVANKTPGSAPFKPGDTVTFSCNEGYVLVGYDTLTCTGLLRWSESTPECMQTS